MGKKINEVDRAKQFIPFDALKGFREALRKREEVVIKKRELSQEDIDVINFKLASIKKGDLVKVTHYQKTHYVETNGIVSEINEVDKYLRIVVMKIAFSDIVNIDIISSEDLYVLLCYLRLQNEKR